MDNNFIGNLENLDFDVIYQYISAMNFSHIISYIVLFSRMVSNIIFHKIKNFSFQQSEITTILITILITYLVLSIIYYFIKWIFNTIRRIIKLAFYLTIIFLIYKFYSQDFSEACEDIVIFINAISNYFKNLLKFYKYLNTETFLNEVHHLI